MRRNISSEFENLSGGAQMFEKSIVHSGLHAFRLVKGQTVAETEMKADLQQAVWAERFRRKISADRVRENRAQMLQQRSLTGEQAATAKALALERTKEFELAREVLEGLLLCALDRNATPDWEARKDRTQFTELKPLQPTPDSPPTEPDASSERFNPVPLVPTLSFLDKFLNRRKLEKIAATDRLNAVATSLAAQKLEAEKVIWREAIAQHLEIAKTLGSLHREDVQAWESRKENHRVMLKEKHASVDAEKSKYFTGALDSLDTYIDDILSRSEYPDAFPKEHQFEYVAKTQTLVLDYELPNQTALPSIKEVRYVASRRDFQETPVSEVWIRKTYDEILYQISLRTVFELFQSDEANALVAIVFNGWVRSIDRATGAEVHACVMSLEARKDEFLAINLRQVEPKACFKKLKGVAASKLIELSPVKPLIVLNKEDKRFVDGYSVVDALDERSNLAAMDWLDFENLIREVFEKEFSKGGGEVKITQASRDGGVDAMAFDPDPIRGGKIVIQAKRYTNTVGVSAVRDLYGTVHNEGANKGILVTTSDFGPDAYAFAKDKPLTLLSGGELLYLLAQHGHSAKIDLAEAKRIAAENGK